MNQEEYDIRMKVLEQQLEVGRIYLSELKKVQEANEKSGALTLDHLLEVRRKMCVLERENKLCIKSSSR